jgi:hypothetical protein
MSSILNTRLALLMPTCDLSLFDHPRLPRRVTDDKLTNWRATVKSVHTGKHDD